MVKFALGESMLAKKEAAKDGMANAWKVSKKPQEIKKETKLMTVACVFRKTLD